METFYQFLTGHQHQELRMQVLAAEFKRLVPTHPQLTEIKTMTDMMLSASVMMDHRAIDALSPEVWCLYRIMTGRPITEDDL